MKLISYETIAIWDGFANITCSYEFMANLWRPLNNHRNNYRNKKRWIQGICIVWYLSSAMWKLLNTVENITSDLAWYHIVEFSGVLVRSQKVATSRKKNKIYMPTIDTRVKQVATHSSGTTSQLLLTQIIKILYKYESFLMVISFQTWQY